jgi:hypothetical protein
MEWKQGEAAPRFLERFAVSWLSAQKKILLRWGNDRLWHRWPLMIYPLAINFQRRHGYFPNLLRPRSLNEKILYRMLFDRREHLPMLTGKLECREFVRKRTGSDANLIPLVAVFERPEQLRDVTLPPQFILKANRGSHMFFIHRGEAPPDLGHLEQLCREWLADDYAKYQREWVYKDVKPLLLIEELLLDEHGQIPNDYKFFCFDGEPAWIRTCEDRHGNQATFTMFRPDWTVIEEEVPFGTGLLPPPPRPTHLDEMMALARTLSRGTDMLRVDLYDVGGRVYVGELTNTPDAAVMRYTPRSLDFELGSHWKLDTRTPVEP